MVAHRRPPNQPDPLLNIELRALWKHYLKSGRKDAKDRNALAMHYYGTTLRSVTVNMIDRYPCTVTLEDLQSWGFVGLLKAVKRFDPGRGFKFASYANKLIASEIRQVMREQDHLSRSTRQRVATHERVGREFQEEHGRSPGDEEMRHRLGLSRRRYLQVCQQVANHGTWGRIGFSDRSRRNESRPLADRRIPQPTMVPERAETWDMLLKCLSREDRLAVILYFREGWTELQIAKMMNLCESGISVRLKRIYGHLREHVTAHSADFSL